MLKHLENIDRRLTSIDGSLAAIAKVFVGIAETGVLERWATQGDDRPSGETAFVIADEDVGNGEWMTRKEAWIRLGIVRSTLEELLDAGELTAYRKRSDAHKQKPRVWLKRGDVEALYRAYTLRKGKEK